MEIQDLEKVIKKMNSETQLLMASSEYQIGKKLLWYLKKIKSCDFLLIMRRFNERKKYRRLNSKYNNEIGRVVDLSPINLGQDCYKTITIYTCITGGYEKPKPPLIKYSNYRFVLFTDSLSECPGWEVMNIPGWLKKKYTNTEINRYIKFHPTVFFGSDYTFYIDGNVRMLTGISDYLDKCKNCSGLAMFNHPYRNCLYEEADACLIIGKGNSKGIREQIKKYRNEKMPEHFGLKEATVILTDTKNMLSVNILDEWWEEFYSSSSKRDQLALPYVLWKKQININDIGNLGNNIREDMRFTIIPHA